MRTNVVRGRAVEVVVEPADVDAASALSLWRAARDQRVEREVLFEQGRLVGLADGVILERVDLASLDAGFRQRAGVPAGSAQGPARGVDLLARVARQAAAEQALGREVDRPEEAGVPSGGEGGFDGVPLLERLAGVPDEAMRRCRL
jgi:hypothetical protein